MNKVRTLATGITLAIASIGAFAQATAPVSPRVDQREANQQKRIDAGVASGPAHRPRDQPPRQADARVAAVEAKDKDDGTVTKKERRCIACRAARARTSTRKSTTPESRRSRKALA